MLGFANVQNALPISFLSALLLTLLSLEKIISKKKKRLDSVRQTEKDGCANLTDDLTDFFRKMANLSF